MKIKYFLISLLFVCYQLIAASTIPPVSPQEQKQFAEFVKTLPAQYQAKYHTPLPKSVQIEISKMQLVPRTIETYNRDFGADLTLQNSVGHTQKSAPTRHSHPVLQKAKKNAPHTVITFNHLLDLYSRDLPTWMARNVYQQNVTLLVPVEKKYGVPSSIAMAILGCETGWGNDIGNFRILDSLATLAFKAPTKKAHEAQYLANLLSFMHMLTYINSLDTDKIYVSTFDGGMGIPQFEPDNYQQYAKSYDGKSNPNIWTSIPDAATSVMYYLHQHGWKSNIRPAYFVKLPLNNAVIKQLAEHETYRPLSFWLKQGLSFQLENNQQLAALDKNINARLFIPTYYGKADSAFLLTDNFEVLMQWNPSTIEGMMITIISESMENPNIDYNTFKD